MIINPIASPLTRTMFPQVPPHIKRLKYSIWHLALLLPAKIIDKSHWN